MCLFETVSYILKRFLIRAYAVCSFRNSTPPWPRGRGARSEGRVDLGLLYAEADGSPQLRLLEPIEKTVRQPGVQAAAAESHAAARELCFYTEVTLVFI